MGIAGKKEFEELDQLFKEWNEKSREGVDVERSLEIDEMLDNKELMNSYQVALAACVSNGEMLRYVSEELRDCKEFVMDVYRNCPDKWKLAFEYVSERLRDDEDVVHLYCQTGEFLEYASDRFWDEEELVLHNAHCKGGFFKGDRMSDRLRDDKDFIRKLCSETDSGFKYASKRLRDDEEFVIEFYEKKPRPRRFMFDYFDWASERIQRKKDIVLMLCERNEHISSQVRKFFSDDEDFAEAILHNSSRRDKWLECLSPRLRDDREYVKRWCETSGGGLKYASDRLKDDTELCIAAVKNYRYAIWRVSDRLKNDLEFCSIVLESGVRLDDLGEAARDDYQIVHRSVELFGYNLEHASERLKNDPMIVFTALNGHFPFTIAYRCDDISGSLEHNIYQYIGSGLKQDPDFAKTVCSCFLKTPIGKKYPADELMKEPMEVYRILEQEGKKLEEWDMDRWDDKSAEGIQGIDFTDVLKQLKEKLD